MKRMTKLACLLLVLAVALSLLAGCGKAEENDIVILYTNDVHCGVSDDVGYGGLVDYKKRWEEKTPYVSLVDCGDAVQGDLIGTISYGEYPVDIMNKAGYDFAILGNHEFDYGMEQLSALIDRADATYLACNIDYTGSGENALSEVKAYEVATYGKTKIGFVGVSTPYSIASSTPTYFMENGAFVYDFCGGDGTALYARVQENVDACRKEGADYVILLTHLGDDEAAGAMSSVALANNTTGVDAILDGHAHSEISTVLENADGGEVLLSSTGTKLNNIGQLVITEKGHMTAGLISDYGFRDADMEATIADIESAYTEAMNTVVANSDVALTTASESGARLVRNRETAIGDFCADAYRYISKAQIAFVNGGGVRADLPAGAITFRDIIAVHPYGNTLCVVHATGQEILDALEIASRKTLPAAEENGSAIGEDGGFLSVSGLRYSIDTAIESTVVMDDNNMFVSIDGARRVHDVLVEGEDGTYAPIDPDATYTLASHNYLIKNSGDGISLFADNELVIDEGMIDYQILITYITDGLNGKLSDTYAAPAGRITVK